MPYRVKVTVLQATRIEHIQERHAVFLPDRITVEGNANTEIRHRAIYDVTLYGKRLSLEGRFASPDISLADAVSQRCAGGMPCSRSGCAMSPASPKAPRSHRRAAIPFEPSIGLPFAGTWRAFTPASPVVKRPIRPRPRSISASPVVQRLLLAHLRPDRPRDASALASDWPHPSFTGAFLPETRDIRADGFTASWRIPHLARSVPQVWRVPAVPQFHSTSSAAVGSA